MNVYTNFFFLITFSKLERFRHFPEHKKIEPFIKHGKTQKMRNFKIWKNWAFCFFFITCIIFELLSVFHDANVVSNNAPHKILGWKTVFIQNIDVFLDKRIQLNSILLNYMYFVKWNIWCKICIMKNWWKECMLIIEVKFFIKNSFIRVHFLNFLFSQINNN